MRIHTLIAFIGFIILPGICKAADTLRVMTYNVLNYGKVPNCQGPNSDYHQYLKTIVGYTNPDVLGLIKMGAVKRTSNDAIGNAPYGFGDSVVDHALNAAFPGRYKYCPVTNAATADAISMLFYNQQKLGYLSTIINYVRTTDFNVYKFYYKDASLSATADTTFLYIVLNHTQSGSNDIFRGAQITGYMEEIQHQFSHLPNMINMGDFNTKNSLESCYQYLTMPADMAFRFYDPPFSVDGRLAYPADWTNSPATYSAFLTTSTRQGNMPNSCGTTGGAKSWYDHLFLSPWMVNGDNYMRYLPESYRTIGNDGKREGISVNDYTANTNTAAPANVIDALFAMSNKYPVMADFLLYPNTTGISPLDPDKNSTGISNIKNEKLIAVANPTGNQLHIIAAAGLTNKVLHLIIYDLTGRKVSDRKVMITQPQTMLDCDLPPGHYLITGLIDEQKVYHALLEKE